MGLNASTPAAPATKSSPARYARAIPEIAAAFSVGRTTVYGWIRDGRLKPTKLGRRTVVMESELARFADQLAKGDE